MTTTTLPRRNARRRILLTLATVGTALFIALLGTTDANAAGLSDPSALTKHNGGMTVTQDGAVIENLEIHGTLRIEASNVTVRNVWVYGSEFWSVYVASGSARFEDVEIGHASHPGSRGIGGNNIVAVRVHIHHVEDGIKLGSNSTYSGVVVNNLASPAGSPHYDALQVEGGAKNSTVRNSSLSSTGSGLGNSAVIIKSDLGHPSNLSFVNNYMNGGNYTIYVRDGGHGVPTGISFIGNRFGDDRRYGLTSMEGSVEWQDNTWASTGEFIDPSGNVIGSGGGGTTTTTAPPPTTTTTTKPPSTTTTTTKPPSTTTSTTTTTSSTSTTVPGDVTTTTVADGSDDGQAAPPIAGTTGSTTTTTLARSFFESDPAPSDPDVAAVAAPVIGDDSDDGGLSTDLLMAVFVAIVVVGVAGYFIGEHFDRGPTG